MKNVLVIVSLLITNMGFGQLRVDDAIVKSFKDDLNLYRSSLGLNPVTIEYNYKTFTDFQATYQAKVGDVTHGEGYYSMQNRYERDPFLNGLKCQENCCLFFINSESDIKSMSLQILNLFKTSDPHNKALINSEYTKIYVSCFKVFSPMYGHSVYTTLVMSE